MKWLFTVRHIVIIALCIFLGTISYRMFFKNQLENAVLKKMVARLEADSRVAEVLVTDVFDEKETSKSMTTIKFLEYDVDGRPLKPRYFTFAGNIIQFQSLVIRFDDHHVRRGDLFRGRSAFLFWKVFMLDGKKTQEYTITELNTVPEGYKADVDESAFEKKKWEEFWALAFDQKKAEKNGVRNAQIEAPGMMFIPGYLYTIKIEHDGGLRIDSKELSPILRGEKLII